MPTFSEVPVLQGFLRDATATSGRDLESPFLPAFFCMAPAVNAALRLRLLANHSG
jgi:hypothetical protein